MEVKYRISQLSDGTKIKITQDLFSQIGVWKKQGIRIELAFLDELKMQDNCWINKTRQFYRHTRSLEQDLRLGGKLEDLIYDKKAFINIKMEVREDINTIKNRLRKCTATQIRRFKLYYFQGYTYAEIAWLEGRSKAAIKESVDSALKKVNKL